MSDLNEEREQSKTFLHDLASPLVILSFSLKKLIAIQKGELSVDFDKHQELLKKSNDAVEKIKTLHSNQKLYLASLE